MGRPTKFSPELAERICDAIATNGKGLDWVCENTAGFPSARTVSRWQAADEVFCREVTRAGARRADILFDECLDIADDATGDPVRGDNGKETQHATEQVARSKLRVDTRLRMIAMLNRKKYGEKLELSGEVITQRPTVPTRDELMSRKSTWAPAETHTLQ